MSKNEENNSRLVIKNNSTQNLNLYSHHKNKSSNFLSDSPSTLITVQLQSTNSNKDSKSKDKNNMENKSTKNIYSPKIDNKNNIKYRTNPKENDQKKDDETKNNNKNHTTSHSKIINIISKDTNISDLKEINNSELDQNSFKDKDINNFRKKLSKIYGQYSANTPKQVISVYNNGLNEGQNLEKSNILVKKNLKLGIQRIKNSPNINDRKYNLNDSKRNIRNENSNNNNKNDYVKYVNNDKHNLNGNILNMTQNYNQSKYVLSQSKSFTKAEKKCSVIGLSNSNNNINTNNNGNSSNNGNNKKNHNFNYINYNNYKTGFLKKKELTVLTKNNNSCRNNNKSENNNNNINSFAFQNVSTSPNANNHVQSYFNNIAKNNYSKKNISNKTVNNINTSKNKSNGGNKSNNASNSNINGNKDDNNSNNNNDNDNDNSNRNYNKKNIYFMKPIQQRKKNSYGKSSEIIIINKDNTTNQSSFGSKNRKDYNYKNTLDSTFLSDIFTRNIENPEELHFFYIRILQNGKEISKKFEIENV